MLDMLFSSLYALALPSPESCILIGATLLAVECVATFTGRGYRDQSRFGGAALGFLVHISER
jgi:hypothetical protein